MADKGFIQSAIVSNINTPLSPQIVHVFKNLDADGTYWSKLSDGSIEPICGGGLGLNGCTERVYTGQSVGAVTANLLLPAGTTDPLGPFTLNLGANIQVGMYVQYKGFVFGFDVTPGGAIQAFQEFIFGYGAFKLTAGTFVSNTSQFNNSVFNDFATSAPGTTISITSGGPGTFGTISIVPTGTGEAATTINYVACLLISSQEIIIP